MLKKILKQKLLSTTIVLGSVMLISACANQHSASFTSQNLQVANIDNNSRLIKPDNIDQWIHLGSNIGQGYNEQMFDASNPGTFQIVKMEPNAYAYFREHGEYADGTMMSLQFYRSEETSNPRLNGFSQGELRDFEIHLIDKRNYEDGHAFFMFGGVGQTTGVMQAPGNDCVVCHIQEGSFDGTFTQFYPTMQNILTAHGLNQ